MRNIQTHIIALFAALVMIPSTAFGSNAADAKKPGLTVVCIDAGHGGKDPGTISLDNKTQEKDLALDIALKLRNRIKKAYPDVKVIMTRSDDTFIELNERAAIANRNNADLFISIHINSGNKSTTANGYSIHVLGQSSVKGRDLFENNLSLIKRENSVILLEKDYSTKYEGFNPNDPESYIIFNLMQNSNLEQSLGFADDVNKALKSGPFSNSRAISRDPFLVLWKTTMPAALIECGFITNASDLKVLRSEEGRAAIADGIFNGFSSFKKDYDHSLGIETKEVILPKTQMKEEPEPEKEAVKPEEKPVDKPAENASIFYGTQVLASAKLMNPSDPFFKGYDMKSIKTGNLYKYFIGVSDSFQEAKTKHAEIIKKFPDSFFVSVQGDTIKRLK